MLKIIPFSEATNVHEIGLRLAPIDVGFDLRAHHTLVEVPTDTTRASYAVDGQRMVAEGTRAEIIQALRCAGYSIAK